MHMNEKPKNQSNQLCHNNVWEYQRYLKNALKVRDQYDSDLDFFNDLPIDVQKYMLWHMYENTRKTQQDSYTRGSETENVMIEEGKFKIICDIVSPQDRELHTEKWEFIILAGTKDIIIDPQANRIVIWGDESKEWMVDRNSINTVKDAQWSWEGNILLKAYVEFLAKQG